jgi:hypothetical protein
MPIPDVKPPKVWNALHSNMIRSGLEKNKQQRRTLQIHHAPLHLGIPQFAPFQKNKGTICDQTRLSLVQIFDVRTRTIS